MDVYNCLSGVNLMVEFSAWLLLEKTKRYHLWENEERVAGKNEKKHREMGCI
jgi:hypothetical protein